MWDGSPHAPGGFVPQPVPSFTQARLMGFSVWYLPSFWPLWPTCLPFLVPPPIRSWKRVGGLFPSNYLTILVCAHCNTYSRNHLDQERGASATRSRMGVQGVDRALERQELGYLDTAAPLTALVSLRSPPWPLLFPDLWPACQYHC